MRKRKTKRRNPTPHALILAAKERGLCVRKKGAGIDVFPCEAYEWHKMPFFRKDLDTKFPSVRYRETIISGKVHILINDLTGSNPRRRRNKRRSRR